MEVFGIGAKTFNGKKKSINHSGADKAEISGV